MRTFFSSLIAAVLIFAMVGLTKSSVRHLSPKKTEAHKKTDTELLVNRPWFDNRPEDWNDRFGLYFFTDQELNDDELYVQFLGGTLAKYISISGGYNACPAHVEVRWIADKQTTKSKYVITKEKNGEFDMKLVMESDPWAGGRSHIYYSRVDWGDESLDIGKFLRLKKR